MPFGVVIWACHLYSRQTSASHTSICSMSLSGVSSNTMKPMCLAAEPSLQVASNKEKKRLPVGSYSVKAMRSTFAYAEIDNTLFMLLRNNDARAMLRVVLINTYLSNQPTKTLPDLATIMTMLAPMLALVS